ncbi:MAG: hypothetical protein ACP5F1_06405 [Thermoplasmata archaeon]|nr:hypothetical protein [Thermoplasmata archaeon]
MIPKDLIIKNSNSYAELYGIDVKKDPFPWFLFSILLSAKISEKIALNTFELFNKNEITSPEKIIEYGWDYIVSILDKGGYTRYDFKTATKLLYISKSIIKIGSLKKILDISKNNEELIFNLKSLGKGIGSVTISIFLRELVGKYNFNPSPDIRVLISSRNLNIDPLQYSKENELDYALVENFLSKIGKNCMKNRCENCLVKEFCNYINK